MHRHCTGQSACIISFNSCNDSVRPLTLSQFLDEKIEAQRSKVIAILTQLMRGQSTLQNQDSSKPSMMGNIRCQLGWMEGCLDA